MGVCKEVLWNHRENLFVENMESQGDFVDSAESSDSIFWICKYMSCYATRATNRKMILVMTTLE